MMEFPRPSYPGDFVSCNVYRKAAGFFQIALSDVSPGPSTAIVLPNDGIYANQFYEVVFGPFNYALSDPSTEMALDISINIAGLGPYALFHQTFLVPSVYQFVPTISAYFDPNTIVETIHLLDPASTVTVASLGAISATFGFAGTLGTSCLITYGAAGSGTVFALRPCDETNNDTFRTITE